MDALVRTTILQPTPYFDWGQVLHLLADSGARDMLDTVDLDAATLQRPLILSEGVFMVHVAKNGDAPDSLILRLQPTDDAASTPSDAALQEAEEWVTRRFQLDTDMEDVRDALQATGAGRLLVERYWPDRPAHLAGPWEGLLQTIIGNQIYPGLSRRLQQGLMTSYGEEVSFNGTKIFLYPTPERLAIADPEVLLSYRFSRQKARALPRLAQMILDEPEIYDWERLRNIPAAEAVETLDALPGVGPWTAQYVAMRGLPHNDYFLTYGDGIKKTLVRLWGVRGPLSDEDAQRLVAAWSPYRRIACYYTYMFQDDMRDMPVAFPGLDE